MRSVSRFVAAEDLTEDPVLEDLGRDDALAALEASEDADLLALEAQIAGRGRARERSVAAQRPMPIEASGPASRSNVLPFAAASVLQAPGHGSSASDRAKVRATLITISQTARDDRTRLKAALAALALLEADAAPASRAKDIASPAPMTPPRLTADEILRDLEDPDERPSAPEVSCRPSLEDRIAARVAASKGARR